MKLIQGCLCVFLATIGTTALARSATMNVDGNTYLCTSTTGNASGVSANVFGEFLGCAQTGTGGASLIVNRCECIDNNGPDLMQIAFSSPPYTERWRTKIQGWDNVTGAFQECWTRLRSAPACNDNRNAWVGRRCTCVDNNGPDLMQIGYDLQTGATLWETKIGGWDNVTGANQQCWNAIQTEPACR
jgi:hypothetical protein